MSVRRALIALSFAVSPVALAAAPVPKEQLLKPPANATHYLVVSEAGKHGDEWTWTLPDGSTAYRESILLRGLVFETDQVVRLGKDVESIVLARAVRWHAEHRVLANGRRTVVFKPGS
jgi:hypothetical protein